MSFVYIMEVEYHQWNERRKKYIIKTTIKVVFNTLMLTKQQHLKSLTK